MDMNHMDHMHHHMHDMAFTLPEWLLYSLGAFFLAGTVFYLMRLINGRKLQAVNGYFDPENEAWHMICLAGMAAMLAPIALQPPVLIWQILFLVGAGWYAIRARTWGKTIKYNKQWYDWAHCGMLFGMWWMFASPITGTIPMVLNIAFWTWFSGYYVYQTLTDLRAKPTFWSLGQDIAHLSMGLVMIGMTAWPHAWMTMAM
jgi:hypothetical protein